jgi:nucleoside permease NupC
MIDLNIPSHIRVRIVLKPSCFIPGINHYQTLFRGKPIATDTKTVEFVATTFQEVLDIIHQPDIETLIIIFEEEKTIQDEHRKV